MKYLVLKPFKYNMKDYVRGDEFDNAEVNMPAVKLNVRIRAGILVDSNSISPTEKAKIIRSKVNKPADKPADKPAEKPVDEEEAKADPVEEPKEEPTEEPTLFGNNVGGGKGRNKRN